MAIDFEHVRRRIDAIGSSLERDDAAAAERVLRDRARALAERRLDAPARAVVARVVVVRCAHALLGLPMEAVREVREVRLTRLPGAPPKVLGVFKLRGRVHGLVDAGGAAREAPIAHGERALAALVTGSTGVVGLRVDEVIGARDLHADEIESGLSEQRAEGIRFVTRDLVQVVDVERLFAAAGGGDP